MKFLFILQKTAPLASISEFARSLLEPPLARSDVITRDYIGDKLPHPNLHCLQFSVFQAGTASSCKVSPQSWTWETWLCPVTLSPLHLSSWRRIMGVLSPYAVTAGHGSSTGGFSEMDSPGVAPRQRACTVPSKSANYLILERCSGKRLLTYPATPPRQD